VLVLTKLTHVFAHPDGGHSVLVKLHDDVQTCAYEDVQVMWEMLQRAETDRLAREPSPKGARALVWDSGCAATTRSRSAGIISRLKNTFG
jgi:hypothetical protein